MSGKMLFGVGVLIAVVISVVLLMNRGNSPVEQVVTSEDVNNQMGTPVEEPEAMAENSDVVEMTVEGGMFYFDPASLVVKQGQKVRLTFTNVEGMHDFVIDELNIQTDIINAGESTVVEFTVPATPGSYKYYCSVANHRQMGMEGVLTIE